MISLDSISAKPVLVTPAMARRWLSKNAHNRKLSRRLVQRYTRLMTEDKWRFTGEPVTFSPEGVLLNGQHRMHALVAAGRAFVFMVVEGVPTESITAMDNGKDRTAADAFTLQGIGEYAGELGQAAKLLYRHERGKVLSERLTPTNAELVDVAERHPGLEDSVYFVKLEPGDNTVSAGVLAFMHYVCSKIDQEDADTFFQSVNTGLQLDRSSPAWTVRTQLERMRRQRKRAVTREVLVLLAKAWNAFRKGMATTRFHVRRQNRLTWPGLK